MKNLRTGAKVSFVLLIHSWMVSSMLAQTTSDKRGLNGVEIVPFAQLGDQKLTDLGKAALQLNPAEWKHAETTNFVYHFFQGFVATQVSVEAEFYYRVLAKDLQKEGVALENKSHIFIFENPEAWKVFQGRAQLEPWTGGIPHGNELFLERDTRDKFKGGTLGHEIAHLVLHHFYGPNIPRWLDEGYAEYSSSRARASYGRARNLNAKPKSPAIAPSEFIPLADLTTIKGYPAAEKVAVFYNESERLVRFLSGENKQKFLALLDNVTKEKDFERALTKSFGTRFANLDALEKEFKIYASKDYGTALGQ